MRGSFLLFAASCTLLAGTGVFAQPALLAKPSQPLTVDPVRIEHSSGLRTLTLPKAVTVHGAQGCSSTQVIKLQISDPKARPGEPMIIQQALRTGKALKLVNAQCNTDGSMSGTALSLEPEASSVDPCSVPSFGGSNPSCAK